MSRVLLISIVCASTLFFGIVIAADEPQPCKNLKQAENLNLTQLLGKWYEINRTDYIGSPTINGQCAIQDYHNHNGKFMVHAYMKYIDNNKIKSEFSTTADIEKKESFLNVTYLDANSIQMKVLETDHTNYAIVCGYYNETVDAGAWILYRERVLKAEHHGVKANASKICSDFDRAQSIEQGEICSHSSITFPAVAIMLASLYISLKNNL